MSTHYLPIYRNNASSELDRMLEDDMINFSFETILIFCKNYRTRGICSLFMYGVVDEYRSDIKKSGRTFLDYLLISRVRKPVCVLSKILPFFDALAVRDFDCALAIASNIDLSWNSDEEFKDDFLFVLFLMKHFFLNADIEECKGILNQYEQVLSGVEDPHFEICMAFVNNDSDAFSKALEHFLLNYKDYYSLAENSESILPEMLETEGRLAIEGIALVNLAETKGFNLESDYLFIPSICRD